MLFPLNLKCLMSSLVEVLVISCAQAVHKKIECYLSGPFWHLNHKKHHEGSKRSPLSFAHILGILSDRRLVQRLWDILCFKLSCLSWLLHRLLIWLMVYVFAFIFELFCICTCICFWICICISTFQDVACAPNTTTTLALAAQTSSTSLESMQT